MSIVRVGLSEQDGFGDGYDAIFGKKKAAEAEPQEKQKAEAKPDEKAKAEKK